MTEALLAFEQGPGRGLGHRMRMEALADPLRDHGLDVSLCTVDAAGPTDLLVVDSYEVRADDRRFHATVVGAIDDLERDLAVDVLIDPTPGGGEGGRRAARAVLQGFSYALVRRSPLADDTRPIAPAVERLLVASGAADESGWGASVSAALHERLPEAEVQMAAGPWSKGLPPHGVRIINTRDGLLPTLSEVDLVVTAGGVTLIEALLLGRPTVAVPLAANQGRAVAAAAARNAAVALPVGVSLESVTEAVAHLASDHERRMELAANATATIDGGGPGRVAEALVALL